MRALECARGRFRQDEHRPLFIHSLAVIRVYPLLNRRTRIGISKVGHRVVVPPNYLPATVPLPTKILVVDDQPYVLRTLRSLLVRQSHWQIYEAENGKTAIKRTRELEPHVVVLDIVMPEMNGIEAAYEIRQFAPETKIVLISSHYTAQEAQHLARLFSDSTFIPKSESGKTLVPRISSLLSEERKARY